MLHVRLAKDEIVSTHLFWGVAISQRTTVSSTVRVLFLFCCTRYGVPQSKSTRRFRNTRIFLWPSIIVLWAVLLLVHSLLHGGSTIAKGRSHVGDGTYSTCRTSPTSKFVLGAVATTSSRHASASFDGNQRTLRIVAVEAPRRRPTTGQTPRGTSTTALGEFSSRATLGLGEIPKGIVGSTEGKSSILCLGGTGREAGTTRGNVVCRRNSDKDSSRFVRVRRSVSPQLLAALGQLSGRRHLLHHVSAHGRGQASAAEATTGTVHAIDALVEIVHHLFAKEGIAGRIAKINRCCIQDTAAGSIVTMIRGATQC